MLSTSILMAKTRVSSVELSVVLSVEKMSVEKNVTLNSTIFNTDLLKKIQNCLGETRVCFFKRHDKFKNLFSAIRLVQM